jgi:hypothetical protein
VFVPSLAHACLNAFASGLLMVTVEMNPLFGGAMGMVSIGLLLLLATVLRVGFPVPGRSEQGVLSEAKEGA